MKKIFLIFVITLILSLSIASAFEFDNIKTYDSVKKELVLKNSIIGLPTTEIAKVRLETPIHNIVPVGSDIKVAELNLDLSLDYSNLINSIKLYNINNNMRSIDRPIKIKYSIMVNSVVNDYINVCNEVKEKNGSFNNCVSVVNGTKNILVEKWLDLDQTSLKAKNYKIGLFTDVFEGDKVEWIPNIAGLDINEWADFSAYTLQVQYNGSGILQQAVWNGGWKCQSFTNRLTNFTLAGISIRAYRVGASSVMNFSIYTPSSLGFPNETAEIIALNETFVSGYLGTVSPGEWVNITFDRTPTIINQSTYFICGHNLDSTPTNYMRWLHTDSGNLYPDGGGYDSGDGGKSWAVTAVGADFWFRVYGNVGLTPTTPLVTATLNKPVNNFVTNNTNIVFNFTIEPYLANTTRWNLSVWYSSNSTLYYFNSTNVFTNETLTIINNNTYFPEDTFKWGVTALGNNSLGFDNISITNNYTFIIDLTPPNLLVNYPFTNVSTKTLPIGIVFNITSSDPRLDKCYYTFYANTSLNPYTCNTNLNLSFINAGNYSVVFYANDTAGNVNSTIVSNTIFYTSSPLTYPNTIIEGEQDLFYYNVTSVGSPINLTNVTLVYDNVFYNMLPLYSVYISGTNYTYPFYINITAPFVNTDTNYSFYAYYVANEASGSTLNNSQFVINIPNLTISSGTNCSTQAFNFILYDEENLTLLNGVFKYNFLYGLTNSSLVRTYGTISGVSNFSVCFNNSISTSFVLGYGEIDYTDVDGYYSNRVYYLFSNMTFTNSTATTQLKDLLTTSSTTFSFGIKDTSLNAYVGYYTALLRWYPNLNLYSIVDMGLTDDTGTAIMKVKAEDVDYRVGVYDVYGNLQTLASPVRFVCQTAPCTYGLVVLPTALQSTDIIKVMDTLVYNKTTKMVTYIYNDPTQNTAQMNLSVYLYRADIGNTLVCNTATSGVTGVLTCNLSAYNSGTFYAVVQRQASPWTYVANLWIELTSGIASLNPTIALFITLIILMLGLLIGAGTGNAIIVVIFGVISLIPALALGAVPITFIIAIAIIGGVIVHYARKQ